MSHISRFLKPLRRALSGRSDITDLGEGGCLSASVRSHRVDMTDSTSADHIATGSVTARQIDSNFRSDQLARADLRGIKFPPGADLVGADLTGADLRGADLSDAYCGWGDGADLTEANLTSADLRDVKLGVPDFTRANLTDANVAGVHFDGCPETGYPILRQANLTRANLTRAKLVNVTLEGADCTDAKLSHAVLIVANLTAATLAGTDLTRADRRGADLTDAILPGGPPWDLADLVGGNLSNASLRTESLQGDALSAARWDNTTRWPDAQLATQVHALSQERSNGTFEITPVTRVTRVTPDTGRTIHVRRAGTTRFDAVIISVMAVALGLFAVVNGALIVIGFVDPGGVGEVFDRVFGVLSFACGVGILGTLIAEVRSDFPWARDDSDGSNTTSREGGIEFGDFDDGGD